MEEICNDANHADQISSLIIDQPRSLLLTASHDLSIAYHRMADNGEQLVEKTLLKVQVENKINEIIATSLN